MYLIPLLINGALEKASKGRGGRSGLFDGLR